MNWLKRWAVRSTVDYAAEYVKKLATVENLSGIAADNVTKLLTSVSSDSLSADKRAKLCETVKGIALICSSLADALHDGEVTVAEVTEVGALVTETCAASPITDETIGNFIDKLAATVKEKVK